MSRQYACKTKLELTTTKGEPHLIKFNSDFGGFDITLKPIDRPATLKGLVKLILRRRKPSEQYVAELNGVKVIEYEERLSFRQAMSNIKYKTMAQKLTENWEPYEGDYDKQPYAIRLKDGREIEWAWPNANFFIPDKSSESIPLSEVTHAKKGRDFCLYED
ncbi:hypothetical protein GCM10027341_54680 [Spirosoma knui]